MTTASPHCAAPEAREGAIKIAWGLNATTGHPLHIKTVQRGLACDCVCMSCKKPLIARKGKQLAAHFSHAGDQPCGASSKASAEAWETALHLIAKEVVETAGKLRLPEVAYDHRGYSGTLRETMQLEYEQATQEHDAARSLGTQGQLIPDVLIVVQGHPLIVEIFVTHKTEEEKIADLKRRGLHAIEIDLSGADRTMSPEKIRDLVLFEAPRHWLHHRLIVRQEQAIDERIQAEREAERNRLGAVIEQLRPAYPAKATTGKGQPQLQPDLKAAGLAKHLGAHFAGDWCMLGTADEWQAQVLNRLFEMTYKPAGGSKVISPAGLLKWLERDIVHPAFRERRRWKLSEESMKTLAQEFGEFALPEQVVENFLEDMVDAGIAAVTSSVAGDTFFRVSPFLNLKDMTKAIADRRRRYERMRDLVAKLVESARAPDFDIKAWFQTKLPGRDQSPLDVCLQKPAYWNSPDPTEDLVREIEYLHRLTEPFPAFVADEGRWSPPAPWFTHKAPSEMGQADLLGLPLAHLIEARLLEERAWRIAEDAFRAAESRRRDEEERRRREAYEKQRQEDARRAKLEREREDQAFRASVISMAADALGSREKAREWATRQFERPDYLSRDEVVLNAQGRNNILHELHMLEVEKRRAADDRRETEGLYREILSKRGPGFETEAAVDTWLRSVALKLPEGAFLPPRLTKDQRADLRAAFEEAIGQHGAPL